MAARDAQTFFEDRGEARAKERSFDGLAHHEAVQQARIRPWDRFSKRALEQAGVDPELGRRAARDYEPHLLDDPAALAALHATWGTQVYTLHATPHTLHPTPYTLHPTP